MTFFLIIIAFLRNDGKDAAIDSRLESHCYTHKNA